MASSYTGLGTELMTTGENAGTWGTTTNTNLQIIEQISGGYTAQSIAGSAQTTTLSVSDGSTGAVLAHRVIEFTGTITGNQIVTIPLDVQQLYVIKNGTSGAYTVQFKYVSGSGDSVTWGASDKGTKLIYAAADHASNPNLVDSNIGGVGAVDLNGATLTLDADADTDITADTDDQIDIRIAGADDFQFTANTFTAQAGSTIAAQALTATTITASGIVKTDDTTEATSTTDGSLQTDGGLSIAKDAVFGDDVKLLSDSAVLSFGADSDTTLTHTDGTGLTLNSTNKLLFRDTGLYINSSTDGQLDLVADTEIQIAATTIDINGAIAMDGAITGATNITLSGELDAATLDISGNADIDGTTNLDAVDIDGAVQLDATFTVGADDQGYDVKFFGDTASAYMLWDTSADDLVLAGAAGIDLAGDIDVDGTANLDAVDIDGAVQIDSTVTVGVDDTGHDVKFFGATSGAYMLWDESTDDLVLAGAAKLYLYDAAGGEYISSSGSALTIASGGTAWELPAADGSDGQLLKTDGSGNLDWTTVSGTITALNNATANELVTVGATTTELDAEANLTFDGTDVLLGGAGKLQLRDTGLYVASNADGDLDVVSDGTAVDSINLESAGGITLDAGTASSGIVYEDDGTEMLRVHNSSSDVIVESKVSNKDIIFKVNDGGSATEVARFDGDVSAFLLASGKKLMIGAAEEYISGDGTDISFTVGSGGDINIGSDIGLTFGNDGEKIEGDGTDLTIAGNNINLTAVADVVIPANVGITFGSGEKIEGDSTDLTVTSGGALNLTATTDVVIPANVGITFGSGEKIEGDSTDLTVTSGGAINLTATTDVVIPNSVGIQFGGASEKIEGDGTDLTISANNLTVDAAADIILDAAGNDFQFKAGGTHIFSIVNSSSDIVFKPIVDAKDIIFQQRDGTEVARIEDNATFNVSSAGKFAYAGTAVTATATELNLLDGGTSVGSSITLADADGIVVNDGGSMKTIPASDLKTYNPGGTSWQSIITSNTTMVSGRGYFVNTTSAAITMTLPSSPSLGDTCTVIDYAGTADSNNITIGRNSQPIMGSAADLTVATERAAFTLVYVDSTHGWLLTEK